MTKNQWTALCTRTLRLATGLLPFAAFMRAEREIHSVILSLFVELPKVRETAVTLAELFPDSEMLSAETQDKLRWILKEWQGAFVANRTNAAANDGSSESPRGETLATVYHNAACQHQKLIDQRCRAFGSYEETVFTSENPQQDTTLMIGSRPFECYHDFIKLLDTVYSVSFSHELNSSRQMKQLPLVETFLPEIRRRELNSELRYGQKMQRNISVNASDALNSSPPKPSIIESTIRPPPKPSNVKLTGLFRSRSIGCLEDSNSATLRGLLQPQEVDVLTPESFAKNTMLALGSSKVQMSPRNTNNNNAGNSRRHSPVRGFGRCTSLVEFTDAEDTHGNMTSEYLIESVLSDSAVKKLEFADQYVMSEKMADWMNAYTGKSLTDWLKVNPQAAAISVRISSKMLTYALWLIENRSFVAPRAADIVVAVVQQHSPNPISRPASLLDSPSPTASHQSSDMGSEQTPGADKKKKKTPKGKRSEEQKPQGRTRAKKTLEEEYGTVAWGTKRFALTFQEPPASSSAPVRAGNHEQRFAHVNFLCCNQLSIRIFCLTCETQ
jgi:hypothetical protein